MLYRARAAPAMAAIVLDGQGIVVYKVAMRARLQMCCCTLAREIPGAFVCSAFGVPAH
jgi:hypothetical protein